MTPGQACQVLKFQPLASRSVAALETLREIIFHEPSTQQQQATPLTGSAARQYHDKLYRRVNRGLTNIIASGLNLDQKTFVLRSFKMKVVKDPDELMKRLINLVKSNKLALDLAVHILSGGSSDDGGDGSVVPGVLGNDFYPDDIQDIRATKEVSELINMERMEGMQFNHFTMNQSVDNPLLVAGGVFADRMAASLQLQTCSECLTRWTHDTARVSGKCPRCTKDRHQPTTYSPANNLHPGEVPEQLRDLTFIEQLSICQISPMMQFLLHSNTSTTLQGHAVSFHDTAQSPIVEVLPRLPDNLGVCIVVGSHGAGGQHDLRANRSKIRQALMWLREHNLYYRNIVISEEALSHYPDGDGQQAEGLIQLDDTEAGQGGNGSGNNNNVQQQQQQQPDQYRTSIAMSDINLPTEREKLMEAVRLYQQQQQSSNQASPSSASSSNVDSTWRHQLAQESMEGFYTRTFPYLLPTGDGDFTIPRIGNSPESLLDWAAYLTRLVFQSEVGNRFASDMRFVHLVTSIHLR